MNDQARDSVDAYFDALLTPEYASPEQVRGLPISTEWYRKGLEIWTSWSKHAVSSVYDKRRRQAVEKAIAD